MGVVRSWRVSATVAVNAIARCRVRSRRRTTCEDPKPPQPSFRKISAVAFAGPFALPGAKAARGIADSHSHPLTQAQPSCSQPCQTRTGGARLSWSTTLAARRLRGTCPPCGMTSARLCAPGEEWELRAGRRRGSGKPGWAGERKGRGREPPQGAGSQSRPGAGAPEMLSIVSSPSRPCPAMEFPDLGAHCSEPSCQRLGEGRSARGRGRVERVLLLRIPRRVGSGNWKCRIGAGLEVGAVSKEAWLRVVH